MCLRGCARLPRYAADAATRDRGTQGGVNWGLARRPGGVWKVSVVAMTRAPASAVKPLGSFRLSSFDPCVGCTTERPGTVRGEQDRAREAPGRRFWSWRSGGLRCAWRKSDGERHGGCEDGSVRLGRKGWRPEERLQEGEDAAAREDEGDGNRPDDGRHLDADEAHAPCRSLETAPRAASWPRA